AGSLALLYILTWLATSSTGISWCAVLALGLSRAFLAHATNSAEPMVGLFFSFLALLIVVASLRRGRTATIFLGGLCFATAMATSVVSRNVRFFSRAHVLFLSASVMSLLIIAWPLMYGGPLYDKFWLQPLALLVFMIAVLCDIEREGFQRGLLLRTAIAVLIVL